MTELAKEAAILAAAQYADSTNKSISTAMGAYVAWCHCTGEWPDATTGITPAQFTAFLALLGRTLAYNTITNYVSMGVRLFHIRHSLPYIGTDHPQVRAALAGIRRTKGDAQTQKLPITIEILRKIRNTLDLTQPNEACFWAACLVAFFCLLRKGNLTANSREGAERDTHVLRRSDVATTEGATTLKLRHTKTIQFQERVLEVVVPGLPDTNICPETALAEYLHMSREATSDILMQTRERDGKWVPYTYQEFMKNLKGALKAVGTDPDLYAGHSFRRGGATWALEIGIPIPAIKALGDWKSDAYLRYIQVDMKLRLRTAHAMAVAVWREHQAA
jgi:hypothetical protein